MTAQSISHTKKSRQVIDLAGQIKNAKTFMIISIKSLPSKQFQDIKKSVREHATIKVVKKNIMLRAINEVKKEKESITSLEKHIKENSAFAISNMDGFEFAGILAKKKNPVFAKAGQTAPDDIEVQAGPTDLVPGPAISELGSLGIQVAVENGKISIKSPKVVVNKNGVINGATASLLQKLNIQPFKVGLEPQVIYDVENEKVYTDIKIDPEGLTEELKSAAGKALGFAQKIVYYCKETIGYFLAKANADGQALDKLQPAEEEKKEDVDNDKSTQDPQGQISGIEKASESKEGQDSESSPAEDNSKEVSKSESKAPTEEKKEEPNTQLNNPEETA